MEIEALLSLFKRPFTTKYPFEPSPSPDGFRGRTEFTETCVGCGACVYASAGRLSACLLKPFFPMQGVLKKSLPHNKFGPREFNNVVVQSKSRCDSH